MNINILTMYPEIFDGFEKNPIIGRAVDSGAVTMKFIDIKEHTEGCYRKLDDSPYGGGKGMILRVDALYNALSCVKNDKSHVVLLSPKGAVFNQHKAKELAQYSDLVFICGHYEGYDARIEHYVDEMISIGDFILSGGESAAISICDSVIRLLPGVLKDGVTGEESFESWLLEYNQFTHPVEFDGLKVPDVLLSGNDGAVSFYKEGSSIMETVKHRPELLESFASDSVGRSSASVYVFDHFVLKVESSDFRSSEHECSVMKWLSGRLNVPSVFEYYKGSSCFLLMSKMPGRMLCDDFYVKQPSLIIKLVVDAFKLLWSVDVGDCPFDMGPEKKLEIAKYNIEHGLADVELYKWLCDHKPAVDPVFSHGDMCLPNIIVGKNNKIAFIDLGLAGVGDRYCDIALFLRSFKYNVPDFPLDIDRFFSFLGLTPDYDKIKWYTLLDELF